MDVKKTTSFTTIYEAFFTRVTDDMYLEMTELDTVRDLQDILLCAIPRFEFPRANITDYETGFYDHGTYQGAESNGLEVPAVKWTGGYFNSELSNEEINILAVSMMVEWFERQIATTELSREKYSGPDFKFTSQANHMAKLKVMMDERKQECFHLQRLYKRRKIENGKFVTTMSSLYTPTV